MAQQHLPPSAVSDAHLAAIIDSSDDAIISKSLDGIVQTWNRGAERIFGYSAEEMVGRSIRTIIPPELQYEEDEVLRRIGNGERVEHFETVRLRKNGTRVYLSLTVSPVRDNEGRIIGASKIARDVTAQRLDQVRLNAERRAFELVAKGGDLNAILAELVVSLESDADGMKASILILDSDGKLRLGAAPHLPEEYNALVDGLAVGPSAGSCGTAAYRGEAVVVNDITTSPLWAAQPEIVKAAEAAQLRACWSTPIRSSLGRVLGTFAMYFSDVRVPSREQLNFAEEVGRTAATIIELKAAEQSKAQLTAIVNSSEDAIIGIDPAGSIATWSASAERLYGYRPEEIAGRPFTQIVPPHLHEDIFKKFEAIRNGESVPAFDTVRVHKDGHSIEISSKLSLITDDAGNLLGISAIHRDISVRRELERSQQEFIAMVSHELRNPLTVIRGYASILKRRKQFDEEAIDAVVDQALVLERLINDLVDASRVSNRQLKLEFEAIDLVNEVQTVASQAQRTTSAHTIEVDATSEPVVGEWDPIRVRQVLLNLLTNAIKYSPSGGRVRISITPLDTEVRIDVADEGKGISPENIERLFERFFRAEAEGSDRSLGLGLYIARGIVEQHGGRMWAESPGEGQGSTFSFTLPLSPDR